MTDKTEYKTASQQADELVWQHIEQFENSPTPTVVEQQTLSIKIKSLLGAVHDVRERDATYADVTAVLTNKIQFTLLVNFLSQMLDDRLTANTAIKSAVRLFKLNNEAGGQQLLSYGASRITKITNKEQQVTTLVNYGDRLQESGYPYEPYLMQAIELSANQLDQQWAIKRHIEIAAIYQKGGQANQSLSVLNRLSPSVIGVKDVSERDSLLSSLCELYIKHQVFEPALSLAKRFTANNMSFNNRVLAQLVIKQHNYLMTERFIALITDENQRFLVYKSWFSHARRNQDIDKMKQVATEVAQITPSLSPGRKRFEAYLLQANYYRKVEDTDNTEKVIDLADIEANMVSGNLGKEYKEIIKSFRSSIEQL